MTKNPTNPFFRLSVQSQKRVLMITGIATVLLLFVLQSIDGQLKNPQSPNGIVSFELAHHFDRTQQILKSWSPLAKIYAGFSLGIDFLFLIAYSLFLGLTSMKLALKFSDRWIWWLRIGVTVAWLQLAAGILDGIENVALFNLLTGKQQVFLSALAFYCASVKFLFVFLGITFIVLSLLLLIIFKKKVLQDRVN